MPSLFVKVQGLINNLKKALTPPEGEVYEKL
jgi:hypothetical protein